MSKQQGNRTSQEISTDKAKLKIEELDEIQGGTLISPQKTKEEAQEQLLQLVADVVAEGEKQSRNL